MRIEAACSPGEIRVAVMREDHLVDFALWRPGAPDGIGDIYRGRVIAAVPAMAGCFVSLGDADGFLPDSEGGKGLTAGTILPVRITRSAQGGKGPRLTARIPAPLPEGPIGLVSRGEDPLRELAARYPNAPIQVDDPAVAASLRPLMAARLSIGAVHLDDAVAALESSDVELPGGGRISIHPTPALVAIDVDTGSALAAGGGKMQRHVGFNQAILPALAAQIRWRNLSGAILVDLAGLPAKRRAALAPDLARALAEDPLKPRLLGFTALGLAEIVRPRVRPPLHELLSGPHAAGLSGLRAVLAAASLHGQPALRAARDVVTALRGDAGALDDLARRTGRALVLRDDPALAPGQWVLEHG